MPLPRAKLSCIPICVMPSGKSGMIRYSKCKFFAEVVPAGRPIPSRTARVKNSIFPPSRLDGGHKGEALDK